MLNDTSVMYKYLAARKALDGFLLLFFLSVTLFIRRRRSRRGRGRRSGRRAGNIIVK